MTAGIGLAHLRDWIGREERVRETIAAFPAAALAATLDRDDPRPEAGDAVPDLVHLLHFLPLARQSQLGQDGHPHRGGFLPPVALPRRMWAGGRFSFHRPLRVGAALERISTVLDVTMKEGRRGPLVFVTVRHEICDGAATLLVEEQDIVYRGHAAPGEVPPAARPAPADAAWVREIAPDDVLLFRYSALLFNAHRIHYDRRYVTGEEGYPGLIVHGPLLATLLVDLARRQGAERLSSFWFRAIRPVFDTAPFRVCGRPDGDRKFSLWIADDDGALCMEAAATAA